MNAHFELQINCDQTDRHPVSWRVECEGSLHLPIKNQPFCGSSHPDLQHKIRWENGWISPLPLVTPSSFPSKSFLLLIIRSHDVTETIAVCYFI